MIVRPVRREDLPALLEMARVAGAGLTSLPESSERLAERIDCSLASFAGELQRADTCYLFVLEDEAGQVVGISGLYGAVGLREAWYNFRVGLTVCASRELDIHRQITTLFLANDLTGHSAVCALFLAAPARGQGLGRLLSRARFLFMAEYAELFGARVIAEMRGVSDEQGRSPFWDSLGRHFFRMDYERADYLTGVGHKAFIAELMPRFPLYTCFLGEEARAAIGQVHPDAEPAQGILRHDGFAYQGYIDIFDAGPTLECETASIRAVRDSRPLVLAIGTPGDDAARYLIHNRRREDCLICAAPARVASGSLIVSADTARRLGLWGGSRVRAVPLSTEADAF